MQRHAIGSLQKILSSMYRNMLLVLLLKSLLSYRTCGQITRLLHNNTNMDGTWMRMWGSDAHLPVVSYSAERNQQKTASTKLGQFHARPRVTFPAADHHNSTGGTKLYQLVTEANLCEQLGRSHSAKLELLHKYKIIHIVVGPNYGCFCELWTAELATWRS